MDDPYFDHKSAKRFDRQRASGPFGVDEVLPKRITAWIQRKHPDTGKKQVLLNFVDWQRSQAARIIADFELYVYEWTLTTVKHRESLDKQDKRDVAQAIFARDRNGRLVPLVHEIRSLVFEPAEGEEAQEADIANLALLQRHALEELFTDDGNNITEEDRPSLTTCLEMTETEFALLETLVRVYDQARCHFISEICEPPVKRYLNAIRIRVEEDTERMPFSSYRSTLLDRMQNSSVIDGLISYILKPRENNCTLSLWVAERVAEKKLLNEDGIEMSEETWLELVLAFVTSEEKQILRVPARDQRAEVGDHAGYSVVELQRALAETDPNNFKRFRQANCFDPVALRVIALDKLSQPAAEGGKNKKPPKLESNALQKAAAPASGAKQDKKPAPLPLKEGQPDKDVYAKFPEKSLRHRLWNAIVAKKCVRCNGDHLRSACAKERQAWEDDFEKPDFWTRKAPAKQSRVQLSHSLNVPCPSVLHVLCPAGLCLIDTCSDVSLARRDVLTRLQDSDETVVIAHLGGETSLNEVGCFVLEGEQAASEVLENVFAIDGSNLPAGVVALLGVADIRRLGLSLDYVAEHPGVPWQQARRQVGFAGYCHRLFEALSLCFRDAPGRRRGERTYAPLAPVAAEPALRSVPESRSPATNPEAQRRVYPAFPDRLFAELKARAGKEHQSRTSARVESLFASSPPANRNAIPPPLPRNIATEEARSVSIGETFTPTMSRRGRSNKWYGIRVGRQPGVCDTWDECRARVDGVSGAEFRSFRTAQEAMDYVKAARLGRKVNYMNLSVAKTSFVGGRALRAVVRVVQEGETCTHEYVCCLDSGSDVNLATRHLLHDVRRIDSEVVFNCGDETSFAEEGTLRILTAGTVKEVPALVAGKAQLPFGCDVLLGVPGVDDLGVQLDGHRGKKAKRLECHVGEKTLRTWLEANGAKEVAKVSFDVSEVSVNPELPEEMQARVRALLTEFQDVFAGEQDSLPKPFAAEPVALKFVSNPEPQSVPEPRWTFAQRQILTSWAEEGLKNGSLELSTSSWASRPHIVMKTPAHTHKDLIDIGKCKLRVCGDYRRVNTQIVKIVPNLPNGLEEVEKAAGHEFFWETDAVACYSQFVLAPGQSREALAIWSPLGLVQPTTLPFGQRNSGTEAQGPYRAAASELHKARHGNYVDDWIGYANDTDQLYDDFARFLRVCRKYAITLGPPKTRFGFKEAQFFGFRVNKEGSHLALKHLDPIRNLVPPVDVHELRRVLGLFVVSRKYIKDYALITKPLTQLLKGKAVTFTWDEPQQKAFDAIRDKLLEGVHLAAPDFALPFHLATDASEDGKGGEMYQLPSVPIDQQFPYCPKLHAPDNHAVIFFLSKSFSETERLKPLFYLEGDSLLWGTFKSKYYALSSPFPLYTYSDHMPLNWMGKTEKGPISSFIIERLSELHTIHQYIPGKLNSIPDSCSRFPMLGPKRMATRGYANSVEEVLKRLPASLKAASTVHFHGGKQSAELRATLKLWFNEVSSLTPLNPPRVGKPPAADIAILTPRCEIAPVILAVYLLSDVPFALLLPVDLLDTVRRPNIFPDSPSVELSRSLERAGKLLILQSQMTWVLGNLPGNHAPTEIFAARLRTLAPVPGPSLLGLEEQGPHEELETVEGQLPRTLEAWTHAQTSDDAFNSMLDGIPDRAVKHDLWICAPAATNPTIIVPPACQELLVRDTHQRMFHLSHVKVLSLLRRSYFWPTMKRDVRKWLEDCPQCELNKARQNTAHGLFSALPVHAPRARWCMDFQGQGTALTGETEALALIDPTSRYVVVIPLLNREASTWLQPFLDRIIFTFGTPDVLHSDAAPEFLSNALALLAAAADITTTTTLAHNARGNGTIEVFWRFWNRCLRILPDDHYARWPAFAQRIAFAYNTASHESIAQVTPFQVQHGAPARNPLATRLLASPPVDEDRELCLPGEFADAVAVSTTAFCQLAKTHDQFVREETAARLNEKGFAKTFQIGDKVKVRVPPTAAQMEETGRRAKHITAWRGPCTIVERLSQTAYVAVDDSSKRRYERVISNLLPYRAKKVKTNADSAFSPHYSDPFHEGEFIAIRDEPAGPFFIAEVMEVTATQLIVHYYGCTEIALASAIFKPCWHEVAGDQMILDFTCPTPHEWHTQYIEYSGALDLSDLHTVLVARKLEFTKAHKLRFRSLRALAPVHDQLFRYDK